MHTHLCTGLRMADDAQTPRAFVALDLRVVCYATSYTQLYGVTHGSEVQIPRAFLALDLHFACYATPYTNGVTHGGEVQGTESPCGTRPARHLLRDLIHRAPQGYKAPRPNTYA